MKVVDLFAQLGRANGRHPPHLVLVDVGEPIMRQHVPQSVQTRPWLCGIRIEPGEANVGDRLVLLARAAEAGARVTVPASALAQAIRRPERQARLARLIRQLTTNVVPLDRVDATNIGRLLAASGTADIVDAHVVVCARRNAQQVVTTDPDDLRRLDPHLDVVTV